MLEKAFGEGGPASGSGGAPLSRRIAIQRNFALRVPRMISRKRGIHRPFVVLDVVAGGGGGCGGASTTADVEGGGGGGDGGNSRGDDDDCFFGPDDEWIAVRSKVKGFRL